MYMFFYFTASSLQPRSWPHVQIYSIVWFGFVCVYFKKWGALSFFSGLFWKVFSPPGCPNPPCKGSGLWWKWERACAVNGAGFHPSSEVWDGLGCQFQVIPQYWHYLNELLFSKMQKEFTHFWLHAQILDQSCVELFFPSKFALLTVSLPQNGIANSFSAPCSNFLTFTPQSALAAGSRSPHGSLFSSLNVHHLFWIFQLTG